MAIEKAFLPSRIRRGRTSTTPVWFATHAGRRLRFARKRDAERFQAEGCAEHKGFGCGCGGYEERPSLAQAIAQVVEEAKPEPLRGFCRSHPEAPDARHELMPGEACCAYCSKRLFALCNGCGQFLTHAEMQANECRCDSCM